MRVLSCWIVCAAFLASLFPFAAAAVAEPGSRVTNSQPMVVAARKNTKRKRTRTSRKKRKRSYKTLNARKKSSRKISEVDKWWLKTPQDGPVQIVVSIEDQQATIYSGGKPVAQSRVSTGKRGHSTPTGFFSILQKNRHHRSNIYSNAPMPFMQRLTWSGIALHASNSVPNYPASHGCVRLPSSFAKKLFKFTKNGAHVVIAKNDRQLETISHPSLFQPIQDNRSPVARAVRENGAQAATKPDLPVDRVRLDRADLSSPVGTDGRLSNQPANAGQDYLDTGTISLASLRLSRTDDGDPGIVPAPPKSTAPIRILVTRRTGRELVRDVQALLNRMSFDAGEEDGYMGAMTGAAIQRFQESEGLNQSGAMSADLVNDLYEAAGKGKPHLGHIYVRQDFKDILDAPIHIKDPELALGAHFFTVQGFDGNAGNSSWSVMSLQDKPRTKHFSVLPKLRVDEAAMQPGSALDRIQIPIDVRTRISALLTPGSSLAISDNGISRETGKGTDFIVLTR